jgi:DNA polymerase-3 subunit delta'
MTAIIGHEAILRELAAFAELDQPPHALLFAGPEGVGRSLLARTYAQMLNCERRPDSNAAQGESMFGDAFAPPPSPVPCGECRPCRLIGEGAHPDVITVGPGDTLCHPRAGESSHAAHPTSRDIRICQVRGMIELASRYPFEARYRMIIIDPADRLGREAANTILKTLEEPPGSTVFALISAAPESIIETVVSRCRRIDVRLVPRRQIEEALVSRNVAPERAALAAEQARGRPGRAIAFAASPALMDDQARLLERCAKVSASRTAERFAYAEDLASRFRSHREATLREFAAWETFWENRLRETAELGEPARGACAESLAALRAVAQAQADLQAQVLARGAIELMLLSFPRVMLSVEPPPDGESRE